MGVRVKSPVNSTFIHLQKTGGSSVQRWLFEHTYSYRFNKHAGFDYVDKYFDNPGVCFTVVRNPYARLVSWYHYFLQKTQARLTAVEKGYSTVLTPKKLQNKYNVEKNQQVLEKMNVGFEQWLLNQNKQIKVIGYQYPIAKRCNIFLKLENIDKEFQQIQDLYNIHLPLPHVNKSQHDHYQKYYTDETIDHVKKHYIKDLDYFGYQF